MQNDLVVRQELQRELEPAERLLWVGRPDPIRMMFPALGMFLFGIPWNAFIASFAWGLFRVPAFPDPASAIFSVVFALFLIPFVLAGLWMLSSPIWAYKKARRTLCGITDRQVLVVTPGRTRAVESYRAGDITKIARTERGNGSGDLTFSERLTRDGDGHTTTEDIALIGVPEVREVERILRAAFRKD